MTLPETTDSSRPERHARPVAAGGWRRALLGLAVGALAGSLAVLAVPRDARATRGRRRRWG